MNPNIQGQQDRSAAELYIETLTGSADTPVTLQTFVDSGGGYGRVLHGSLDQNWDRLVKLNNQGHGIFLMVNGGDLVGRSTENVQSLRALFIDDDGNRSEARFERSGEGLFTGPEPSMTVQSKAGHHTYWVLFGEEPLEEFVPAQKQLAQYFGTDQAVHDLPRVMRVPGFFHLKDPQDPYLVRLLRTSTLRHRLQDVVTAYSRKAPAAGAEAVEEQKLRDARAYVAGVPPAVEGERGDNATYSLCCSLVRGFDLSDSQALELLRGWNEACRPPWPEADLATKIAHARRYGKEKIGGRLRRTARSETSPSARIAPTTSLAFLIPQEQFVYQRLDGTWDLSTCVGEGGAKAHLVSTGCDPKQAAVIVATKMCVLAHGIGCKPGAGPHFREGDRTYLNSYVPSKIVAQPHPWPTIERVLNTVTDGDRGGRDWVFNWIASKIQNPGMRSMTALVLQGAHGTGKSLVGTILSLIIGTENCTAIGQTDVETSFNEPYVQKLLVVADEVVSRDKLVDSSSKLKQMITDPKILMNGKHKAQRAIDNRMTWLFTSNNPTPVKVEGATDRRFTVFSAWERPSQEYRGQLRALFDASGQPTAEFQRQLQGFTHALMEHTVDQQMATTPYDNAARRDLASASLSSAELFFEEVLDRGIVELVKEFVNEFVLGRKDWDFDERGIKGDAVYLAYRGFCARSGNKPMTSSNFGKELHQRHPEWKRAKLSTKPRHWVYVGMPREEPPTESAAA